MAITITLIVTLSSDNHETKAFTRSSVVTSFPRRVSRFLAENNNTRAADHYKKDDEICYILEAHHGYKKALRGIAHKPQSMSDEDWALATIQLFLTQEFLWEVIHETIAVGLWLKLESLYMTKSCE
nr:stigma-specific STIG1-like protein 3 [Tanacetum cinerariifolium]